MRLIFKEEHTGIGKNQQQTNWDGADITLDKSTADSMKKSVGLSFNLKWLLPEK